MRIAALLTDFLYQKKYLNIPGIGKFTVDEHTPVPNPDDKNFDAFVQSIRFEQKTVLQPDDELIDFIRTQTGKIRPLAIADLESLLSDYKGFLNLGKPLFLEGIGNLNKLRSGKIEFTPGAPAAEHVDLYNDDSLKPKAKEKRIVEKSPQKIDLTPYKKPLIIGTGLIAFLLALAGGYYLYRQTETPPEQVEVIQPEIPAPEPQVVTTTPDTTTNVKADSLLSKTDTVKNVSTTSPIPVVTTPVQPVTPTVAQTPNPATATPSITATAGTEKRNFKFILQRTSRKEIAISNYSKVRIDRPDIKMETKDSILFKIYVVQSCLPSDTARIKESLNLWYWGKKEPKVSIEY